MSADLKPVQVRLPEEAYRVLRMLSDVDGGDLGEVARQILTEALLGKGHAIKVLAARLARTVKTDNER